MKDGFCSMGLLQVAGATDEETKVLADIIRDQFPERVAQRPDALPITNGTLVAHFNDHPETTFADVERVFEKAEVAWDERV